ncbi:MAG: TusE/DsrC/DsvC family sulfur relay protein [Pseudomonadales bacterium]
MNLDKDGFLRDFRDWTQEHGTQLASNDQIQLTDAHWEIINLVRAYYHQYGISPVTRVLVKLVKEELGESKGTSIYLMGLFSGKPAKLVSKIAGLPKPANCD